MPVDGEDTHRGAIAILEARWPAQGAGVQLFPATRGTQPAATRPRPIRLCPGTAALPPARRDRHLVPRRGQRHAYWKAGWRSTSLCRDQPVPSPWRHHPIMPVPRRTGASSPKLAQAIPACPCRCGCGRTPVQAGSRSPWSSGLIPASTGQTAVRDLLKRIPNLWADLAFRNDHASGGKVDAGWRCGLRGLPRPLHGRHGYLHARALALYRRACEMVARLAGRSARAAGGKDRLPKRRGAVRPHRVPAGTVNMRTVAPVAILAAILLTATTVPALACADIPVSARIIEGPHFKVITLSDPVPIPLNAPFALDIWICDGRTLAELPRLTHVDAQMPAHRHSMNYQARITKRDWGVYRAEGLLLHMPGEWEFSFELRRRGSLGTADLSLQRTMIRLLVAFPCCSSAVWRRHRMHHPFDARR